MRVTNLSRCRTADSQGSDPARVLSSALPKRAVVLTGDDPDARLLAAALMEAGVAVQLAQDPESAPAAVTAFRPQLVLARITVFGLLNASDRLTVLRERLLRSGVPLILAAPHPAVPSSTLADLLWRVDDFVLEPLSLSELALRLEVSSLRSKATVPGASFVAGRLMLDLVGHKVAVDGEPIPLTHKEFELVRFLADHRGRVVTREMMLEQLWGKDFYGGLRTVDVHIRRIRSKLEIGGFRCIATVRNVGYKFVEEERGAPPRAESYW